ncbi:MAG: TonB-dependent receptor [Paraglaciecola sp.]|nr:TonB-dependent receptor [Paraglaciecola sp.]
MTQQRQLSVNGRIGWSQFLTDTERLSYSNIQSVGSTPDSLYNNMKDSRYYTGELGIEWQQALNKQWQWRILSLNNVQNWFVNSDSNTQYPLATFNHASNLRFDEHKSEHVLRTLLSFSPNSSQTMTHQEYGFETAYSELSSWLTLGKQDGLLAGNAISSKSYSKAQEQRNEVFANFSWQFSHVNVETGFAAEYSQIKVDGDNNDQQSLFFFKPSLSLVYNASQQTQYRFNLRRSVGQLNFGDFAASADLVNDRTFSGNPQLRPDTNIRAAIAMDYRFAKKGALSVELYHEWRQHVLEQIILPSGTHAWGNAGDATVQGLNTSLNLPLSPWLPDAQLSIVANLMTADFNDPITDETRPLTELKNPIVSADFRQNLSELRISWGLGYQAYTESEVFYVNEYNLYRTLSNWTAFIESFVFKDLKVRLSAQSSAEVQWDRMLYKNSRRGDLNRQERTERHRGPYLSLTISQSF